MHTPLYLYPLLLLGLLVIASYREEKDEYQRFVKAALSVSALLTLLAHLMLGGRGVLFRYEAYLVALLGLACAECLPSLQFVVRRSFFVFSVMVAIVFSTLAFYRNYSYHNTILSLAHRNIRDQQLQTAAFEKKHYTGQNIVANDIGALCYLADIRLFDLIGLGTAPMLKAWLKGPEIAERLINSQNFDLMLVYDRWFPHIHFTNRLKIADLIIPRNVICGDSIVSFYLPAQTLNKTALDDAIKALEDFQKTLPQGVKLLIYKTTGQPQDVHVHQSN